MLRKKVNYIYATLFAAMILAVQVFWQQQAVHESGAVSQDDVNTTAAQQEAEERTEGEFATVARVVDGDTIKVLLNGEEKTLRIIGVNTPEIVDPRRAVECFGKEASSAMKERLKEGSSVMLIADSTQDNEDRYGRLLRYIEDSDRQDIGLWLIEQGYAYEYTYRAPYERQAAYQEAQRIASESQIGLWDPEACLDWL